MNANKELIRICTVNTTIGNEINCRQQNFSSLIVNIEKIMYLHDYFNFTIYNDFTYQTIQIYYSKCPYLYK